MKQIILILITVLCTISCENKSLYYGDEIPTYRPQVNVVIHWETEGTKPTQGMRVNLFSLNNMASYGIDDLDLEGGTLYLDYASSHRTMCYNYHGNNIYFRNESDPSLIEAYCSPAVRATYSNAFPDENTVTEPDELFYVGQNDCFDVIENETPLVLDLYPKNVMQTYTFEVRGITGTQYISATRGAISGISNSYFLTSGTLASTPSTLLFNAKAEVSENKITGSFRTFGRLQDEQNNFTIEVLYPSSTGGIKQKTWDVTSQINEGTNSHIVIEDSGIDVPNEGASIGGGGFEADVEEWENEIIELK